MRCSNAYPDISFLLSHAFFYCVTATDVMSIQAPLLVKDNTGVRNRQHSSIVICCYLTGMGELCMTMLLSTATEHFNAFSDLLSILCFINIGYFFSKHDLWQYPFR